MLTPTSGSHIIPVRSRRLDMAAILSTAQASLALGVSQRRVQALIQSGRLPATKVGMVRKPGRPPKDG